MRSAHSVAMLVLYVFFSIEYGRQRILHFNSTFNPAAAWVIQQLGEAFPYDTARKYLIFDGDAIFNPSVVDAMRAMGIKPRRIVHRSPWCYPGLSKKRHTNAALRRDYHVQER